MGYFGQLTLKDYYIIDVGEISVKEATPENMPAANFFTHVAI